MAQRVEGMYMVIDTSKQSPAPLAGEDDANAYTLTALSLPEWRETGDDVEQARGFTNRAYNGFPRQELTFSMNSHDERLLRAVGIPYGKLAADLGDSDGVPQVQMVWELGREGDIDRRVLRFTYQGYISLYAPADAGAATATTQIYNCIMEDVRVYQIDITPWNDGSEAVELPAISAEAATAGTNYKREITRHINLETVHNIANGVDLWAAKRRVLTAVLGSVTGGA